jgi:hypothetical protein
LHPLESAAFSRRTPIADLRFPQGRRRPMPLAEARPTQMSMVKRRPEPEVHTLLFALSVLAMRRGSGSAGQEPVTEAYEEWRCQH